MPGLPEMDASRRISQADTGRRVSAMPGLENGPYMLGGMSRVEMPAGYVDRRRRTIGLQALQESIKEKQVSLIHTGPMVIPFCTFSILFQTVNSYSYSFSEEQKSFER